MKKFIIAVMCVLCSFGAYATGENERATSVGYVTEELTTRQDKFNKLGADTAMTYSGTTDGAVGSRTITGNLGAETNTTNTALPTVGGVDTKLDNKQDELDFAANTVLMNTGVAGAPAAKGIYDDSGSYNTQTDSLVEASTFNAALQTAINSEFTCAQRKDPNDPTSKCLLFNIFAPTQNRIIPAEYTRLEYLESTGRQYIVTDHIFNLDTVLDIKFKYFGASNIGWLFGYTYGDSGRWGIAIDSDNAFIWNYKQSIPIAVSSLHDINEVKIDFRKGCYLNGNLYNFGAPSEQSQITERTMWLFNVFGSEMHPKNRIYYVKIQENDVLTGNFIPAKRNSDGVLGMYDTVTNTFYTNAGSGTFIAGPEISSNIYLPMN